MFRLNTLLLSGVGLLMIGISSSTVEATACYYPDGRPAAGFEPCSTAGGVCCAKFDEAHRDACYSNGLCQSLLLGRIYRGSCTDRSWGSSCPNVCTDTRNDQVVLRYCKGFNGWCCDPFTLKSDCCAEGVGLDWSNATLVNYALAQVQTDYAFNLAGAYTTLVSDSFGLTTKLLSTISSTLQSQPPTPVVTPTGTGSATSAIPTDTCSPAPPITLGAGLAVGLGVPLLVVLGVLLWMMAKQRYHRPESTNRSGQGSDAEQTKTPQTRNQPDKLHYEYFDGQQQWEKPQLPAEERRVVAEL